MASKGGSSVDQSDLNVTLMADIAEHAKDEGLEGFLVKAGFDATLPCGLNVSTRDFDVATAHDGILAEPLNSRTGPAGSSVQERSTLAEDLA